MKPTITEYFEELLDGIHGPNPGAEAMWDSRAAQFSLSQQSEKTGFPGKVTRLLTENGYLPGHTVLDIGGGTGRYALPFAKVARSVTITDLSSGMLQHARQNAQKEGLQNISYEKLDWDKAEIAGSKYEKSHDIVFASMCPAVRSKSGLMKMIAAAKKGCVINQFIKTGDTLADRLKDAGDMAGGYDPHSDRETVQATFHILWELGYHVQLVYHHHWSNTSHTREEAVARYGGRFAAHTYRADGREMSFEEMIAHIAGAGEIPVENETVLATMIWDV
jgi:predicted RNA methylase